jgi:hypothetical protein
MKKRLNRRGIIQVGFFLVVILLLLWPLLSSVRRTPPRVLLERDARYLTEAVCLYVLEFAAWPPNSPTSNVPLVVALTGGNPKGVTFLDVRPEARQSGLRDPWGTPYAVVFPERPDDDLVVRSCGPDRTDDGGGNDDVVFKAKVKLPAPRAGGPPGAGQGTNALSGKAEA